MRSKEAGATDSTSRKAAEAIASYDYRFNKIEADLLVLKWMIGSSIAITLGGFGLVFRVLLDIAARIP